MYVDYAYYIQDYIGEPIDEAHFPRYLARASEAIASIIRYRSTDNFDQLDDLTKTLFKKAICAQVEYYAFNGISLANDSYVTSHSGIDGCSGNSTKSGNLSSSLNIGCTERMGCNGGSKDKLHIVCTKALSLLAQTGLLNLQALPVGQPIWSGGCL